MSSTGKLSKYSSGFTPIQLPGCALWLDAADPYATVTSGANVSLWYDKSGNNRHAVGTGSPQIGSTTTGRRAIVFSGTNYFDVSGASTMTGGAITIIALASATTNGRNLLAIWGNTRIISSQLYYNGNNLFFSTNTLFFNSNALCCIVDNTSTAASFFNGSTNTTGTGATVTTNSQFTLGIHFNYTNGWIGNIQEVLIYGRALATEERQVVEGYLSYKWGIVSTLPATHPDKSLRPFTRKFQPIDVSGCICWLDAADKVAFTGGASSTWLDKSGTANHGINGTPGTTIMPTTTTWTNGLQAARFVRASLTSMKTTSNVPSESVTYFLVPRVQATQGGSRGFFMINNVDGRRQMYFTSAAFPVSVLAWASINATIGVINAAQSIPFIYCGLYGPSGVGNFSVFTNGSSVGSNNVDASTASQTFFGSAGGSTVDNITADFAEILIYDRVISSTERQQIEGYLAQKWNMASYIPSTHPFKLFPPLTPFFNPPDIAGCRLWLDAMDNTALVLSGTTVTQWNDKSGNGNNSTSTINTNVLTTNAINKRQAVYINTSAIRGSLSPTINSTQVHCFMVANIVGGGSFPRYLGLDDGVNAEYNSTTGFMAFGRNAGQNIACARLNAYATLAVTYNLPIILNSYVNSTNHFIAANGSTTFTSASSGSAGNLGITRWNLGCETSGSLAWTPQIYIGEIIVYSTLLPTAQRQKVEGYLAWKWGIQGNLPTTHPYYEIRP